MKTSLLMAVAVLATPMAHAQETVAAGTLNQEMSWVALSSQINSVRGDISILQTRTTQLEKDVTTLKDELTKTKACGNLGLVYGPSHAKADATTGCVPEDKSTLMYLHARERRFQPTGVYVKKGQKLTIKATGMASAGYEHPYYTADERIAYGSKTNYCMLRFVINSSKEFHSDVYDYTGTAFCGKSNLTMTASSTGYLYAGVPEGASSSGDNQGGYMISISVKD